MKTRCGHCGSSENTTSFHLYGREFRHCKNENCKKQVSDMASEIPPERYSSEYRDMLRLAGFMVY